MSTALLEAPANGRPTPTGSGRDPDALYEIIDGIEVEMPPMSMESLALASRLGSKITLFAEPRKLGEVYNEMIVQLHLHGGRDRKRRPDFIYVAYEKWPAENELVLDEAWDIIPDICVEVISPTDKFYDIEEKLDEYFEAGFPQIWIVSPDSRAIRVYTSRYEDKLYGIRDTIVPGDILPGFELPLKELFRSARVKS